MTMSIARLLLASGARKTSALLLVAAGTYLTFGSSPIAAAGGPIQVPGERYEVPRERTLQPDAAAGLRRSDPGAPIFQRIELPPSAAPQLPVRSATKTLLGAPLLVGVHRELPSGLGNRMDAVDFDWEPVAGGHVATVAVRTPEAGAVRLAIDFHRLAAGSEVRFYSPSSPEKAMGPFGPSELASGELLRSAGEPFWSPVLAGDEAAMEIFVPGRLDADAVSLTVRRISHLERHPLEARDIRHVGNSDRCERDVACFKPLADAADSVAKIVFEVGVFSYLCSGQLINDSDPDTFEPYFTTAAHCISNNKVARTATFFWFFQRDRCRGADPQTVTQTSGGARLRVTTRPPGEGRISQDFSLLQLRKSPPSGVTFAGWRVQDPVEDVGERIHGIHHPAGDVKMASRGRILGLIQIDANGFIRDAEPYTHYVVQWSKGVTEGGSSGSAIWAGRTWPEQYALGPLTGGTSFCDARQDPDIYGIFSEVYQSNARLRRLLGPGL